MPRQRFRIGPFACLMLFFILLLALGLWLLAAGLQPPALTHSLPYTV